MLWFESSCFMKICFDGNSEILSGYLGGSDRPPMHPTVRVSRLERVFRRTIEVPGMEKEAAKLLRQQAYELLSGGRFVLSGGTKQRLRSRSVQKFTATLRQLDTRQA